MINRVFILRSPSEYQQLQLFVRNNAKACNESGKPLVVTVSQEDKTRSAQQNRRYWAILGQIAEQAWVNGHQYSRDVWHEHFGRLYLALEDVTLPTGEIIQRRATTTRLDVAAFNDYMEAVERYAASELGICIELP